MRARSRRRILPLLLLIIVVGIALFFIFRSRTQAAFGPTVAFCPGPDRYGYICKSGGGFAYLDATVDTRLYEDDGTILLDLPFPFSFYGTTFTQVQASSNGNLQFSTNNRAFLNECLTAGPVVNMGDMVAPYWDDLDLRNFGFLEHETFGQAPERIYVIEWDDIPRFGENSDDRVTFEVQLFEKSNDIVFLYQDVDTLGGYNGSSATIGLQSEVQGLSLQYGCNQPVVANASGVHLDHPEEPNQEIGLETLWQQDGDFSESPVAKGQVDTLLTMLDHWGPAALGELRDQWRSRPAPRNSDWRWLDLTGDGQDELLFLWRSPPAQPQLTQLVVVAADPRDDATLLLDVPMSDRETPLVRPEILETVDLTADGVIDVLLVDSESGQLFVITSATGDLARLAIPQRCRGNLAVLDSNADGRVEIVRDNCGSPTKTSYSWNGREFVSNFDLDR